MTVLQDEMQLILWHFVATSHGKGAVDGIGGEIKKNWLLRSTCNVNFTKLQKSLKFTQAKF